MAVSLTRQGEEHTTDQATKLPQLTIRNLPILTPEHFQSGPVTGRTQTVFSCNSPGRETFWKENYERRQGQLSEGGFHGTPGHKYQEVGDVQLDDKTLILQALGQMHLHHVDHSDTKQQQNETHTNSEAMAHTDTVGKFPTLRSRATSQLPDKLMTLHNELERADIQLDKIRKGYGLFDMFHKDKTEKESAQLKIKAQEERDKALEWIPAITTELHEDSNTSLQEKQQTQSAVSEESTPDYRVSLAYSKLCTILWILECMKLDSPQNMPSIHSFWHTNRPPVNEDKGRLVYERTTALLKQYDQLVSIDKHGQAQVKHKDHKRQQMRPTSKQQQLKIEEGKLRKQRKLSPEQIEKLKQLIEEELNHTKKKSKNSLKQLMEEKALLNSTLLIQEEVGRELSDVQLDSETMASSFNAVEETRNMIVHEQLSAMARDRQEAIEQRFSSLRVSGNMWIDLKRMRQGVEIETTSMASNKLMMNYNWLVELENELPEEAFTSRYCQELLIQLSVMQDYMRQVGPQKMSQDKLMSVLSLLRPWELESATVAQAVKFLTSRVIYTVTEDYEAWLDYHTKKYNQIIAD